MFKLTTKKLKLLLILSVFLSLLVGGLVYFVYSPLSEDKVFNQIKSKLIFAKEEKDYIYQKLNINANEQYKLVGLKSNLSNIKNPIYTLVHSPFKAPDNSIKSVQIYIFNLGRNSILSQNLIVPDSAYRGLIVNKDFDEIVKLVSEKDLSKDKVSNLDLTINPPLTSQQIQQAQDQQNNQVEIDRKIQEAEKRTPAEKYTYCMEKFNMTKAKIDALKRGDKIFTGYGLTNYDLSQEDVTTLERNLNTYKTLCEDVKKIRSVL